MYEKDNQTDVPIPFMGTSGKHEMGNTDVIVIVELFASIVLFIINVLEHSRS
jgi:hypothetical protein